MGSCPNLLSTGSCNDARCPHEHDIFSCDACCRVFKKVSLYRDHCNTRKHKNKVSALEKPPPVLVHCPICDSFTIAASWKYHKKSKRHLEKALALNVSANVEPETDIPQDVQQFCAYCRTYILLSKWDEHTEGKRHKHGEQYTSSRMIRVEAEKDQNGVEIQGDLDFGIVEPDAASQGVTKSIEVCSTTPVTKIKFVSVKVSADFGSSRKGSQLPSPFATVVDSEGVSPSLSTSHPLRITITFKEEHAGRYQDRIQVQFEDRNLKEQFSISRTAQAIVGDPSLYDRLKPRAPYIPRVRAPREPEIHIIEGVPPSSLNAIPYVSMLPKTDIPGHLLSALTISSDPSEESILSIQRAFLPKTLDAESYERRFKTLLWIEEHQMGQDLEGYDIAGTTLGKYRPYYHLIVPGLADKRPSVLVGDQILVRRTDGEEGHWYEGRVHFVRQHEVGLRFHKSFGGSPYQMYHIRFKLNRIPIQRQHQALNTAFTQPRILFPDSSHLPTGSIPEPRFTTFNSVIAKNPAQSQAVGSIMEAVAGSLPFIIFGPPGTGKTVTIVEAIKQLMKKDPQIKILACAPSNSEADLIALRLLDAVTANDLFRLCAPSRNRDQMPDELGPYTFYRGDLQNRPCFGVPSLSTMQRYRIIVATCTSASILPDIGMPRGHFSHIFVDEAGQATEPEVFVAIRMMADTATNVVLSGDPKQLGPIIRSGIASRLGLGMSYLERLMGRSPYDLQIGFGKSIVKLVKNFRSHEAILTFPNVQFYGNDLETCADRTITNAYLGSSCLPNKEFPVIFHSISGKDDREASSPSFFNVEEALQVKTYVQQLKADTIFRTTDHDIGVITPYHAQCLKIRGALHGIADEVKVGPAEEFQGQERTVIIISAVRSSEEFVSYDIRHNLGFVANPRCFNVSVTRAKALLIIIGDPNVLGLDPLWRSFLEYVHHSGGWKGPVIPWDPSGTVKQAGEGNEAGEGAHLDVDSFTSCMEELTMECVEDDTDAGVDKPWRELE